MRRESVMPPAAVHGLRTGSFTLSRILFRTNVISGNTPEIPLGLLSELVVGPCRVLGMSIRRKITPRELSWLPDSWHADLAQPATYWSSQFDLSLIHISEPTRLGISYAVFCLKKKKKNKKQRISYITQNQKQKQIKKQKKHKN